MLNLIKRLAAWWHRSDELDEEIEREMDAAEAKWEREMMNLPIDEAKRRALALLDDPTYYRCERAPLTDEDISKLQLLPPYARSLFEQYKSIYALEGYQQLDRAGITEADLDESGATGRYVMVGRGVGGHNPILVRPPEEAVYLFDAYGQEPPERVCDSIYHYLLYIDTINRA